MWYPRKEAIELLRKEFPPGTRVELVRMDDPMTLPVGTKGSVDNVDSIGTIHVRWDNGSCLGVAYGEDVCRRSRLERRCCNECEMYR